MYADLIPSNIVFGFPDTLFLSPSQVCDLLGPIRTEKLKLPNGTYPPHASKCVVQTHDFSGLTIPLSPVNIQIVDFGEAFFIETPPSSLGVPMGFFPPEICFEYFPSPMSDVWELGCLMFEVLSKMRLFRTYFPIFEMLIRTAMPILGPLPEQWKECFNSERYGYREGGVLKDHVPPDWWFQTRLHTQTIKGELEGFAPHLSGVQREAMVQILEKILVFEPEKRLSCAEVERRLTPLSALFEADLAAN